MNAVEVKFKTEMHNEDGISVALPRIQICQLLFPVPTANIAIYKCSKKFEYWILFRLNILTLFRLYKT